MRDEERLQEEGLDGWLLYDFRKTNTLAWDFLKIPESTLATRRFFYWIPAVGEAVKIVHAIEQGVLDHLPGKKVVYLSWQSMHSCLKEALKGKRRVAMEYSPNNAIPVVSKVDAGTVELIRGFGIEVVSSASFVQYYTCTWDDAQLQTHLFAADVLDKTANNTWAWVKGALESGKKISEYDVQQFILAELERNGCKMEDEPMCGVNANAANPHYVPEKKRALEVKRGDLILIDLWCKKKEENAVYADITRMAVAGEATAKQKEVFALVREAQRRATEFVQKRWEKGEKIRGFEVDQVCRKVIEDGGYGKYFTHRTGHNIHKQDHGPGANIDSLETLDDRFLVARSCFSIEPGIYLPGEFGVRLEYDIFLEEDKKMRITGGVQEQLKILLTPEGF